MNDSFFMRLALEEAKIAYNEGEVPVGAVLVHRESEVLIARDHNRKEQTGNPCTHAELLVIQKAAPLFPSWRIEGCTLYVTLEPCTMCAGAIIHARIERVVYGTDDPKTGAVRSLYQILSDVRLNHRCEITSGILQEECSSLLKNFFSHRRKSRE